MSKKNIDLQQIEEQVKKFKEIRPVYSAFGRLLEAILKQAVLKKMGFCTALVATRTKELASFAGKIIRKPDDYYSNPVYQLTDLCGARVILNTSDEVMRVCQFISQIFEIDEANSEDVADRLGESEFGYRSVHYIVSFKPEDRQMLLELNERLEQPAKIEVIDTLLTNRTQSEADENNLSAGPVFKAEIQVRTYIQHAWADFAHDQIYKSEFDVPASLKRDANRIAATLESADEAFGKVTRTIAGYKTYIGAYMSEKEIKTEVEKLQALHRFDENNQQIASQIARFAIALEDWELACNALEKEISAWKKNSENQMLGDIAGRLILDLNPLGILEDFDLQNGLDRLRDPSTATMFHGYGLALWKAGKTRTIPEELVTACFLDVENTDFWISIGDILKDQNDFEQASRYYERAFELKSDSPRALAGIVYCRAEIEHSVVFVKILRTAMEQVIQNCRKRADVQVFLPEAFYYSGLFKLLSGRPYDGLNDYAKAVDLSASVNHIQKALDYLKDLKRFSARIDTGIRFDWAIGFLKSAIYARQSLSGEQTSASQQALKDMASKNINKNYDLASGEIVLISGGCDAKVEQKMAQYKNVLQTALDSFNGIIISGGTKSGICGLVGDIETGTQCTKLAYRPELIPGHTSCHDAYQFIDVNGAGFSAMEPLQQWIDIFAAGRSPKDVKLIGINGGRISAFEYRMAAAFGAETALVSDSGRAAFELLNDPDWKGNENIMPIPNDPFTLTYFINDMRTPKFLSGENIEELARKRHENYLEEMKTDNKKEPSLQVWESLPQGLKESNRQQIEFIGEKLSAVGLSIEKEDEGSDIEPYEFTPEQLEIMSEMEHARWNLERLRDGWTIGKKDVDKKISPYIIPWNELKDEIREYDRKSIKDIPDLLSKVNYKIIPVKQK